MAPSLTISSTAYYKLYFHAAKHAHQPVNGVLLGTQAQPGSAIEVVDAVPLLHHWTSLSPMMEIGLDLAGQYADEAKLKVVGYYQAQANVTDVGLGPVGEKILQTRLKEKFKDALGFVIDGQEFGTDKAALIPWIQAGDSGQWRPESESAFSAGSQFKLASADLPLKARDSVKEGLHQAFGDFDDHLEDVTIDWIHNRACIPFSA